MPRTTGDVTNDMQNQAPLSNCQDGPILADALRSETAFGVQNYED